MAAGKTPLDLALPWIPYRALTYLERLDLADQQVTELGSGGSTLYFASQCSHLVSIETDLSWLHRVEKQIVQAGLTSRCQLVHREADFTSIESFQGSPLFREPLPPADIFFIDSFDFVQGHPFRPLLLERIVQERAARRLIILDDAERYGQAIRRVGADRVHIVEGLKPARRTSSSTAFLEMRH